MVGLIGHNGSGKPPLLKLLARQQAPSHGSLSLDGKTLADWQERAFAREVAYLPQQLPAASSLTVRELVGFGRYTWHGLLGRFSQKDHEKVAQALALVRDLSQRLDLGVVVVLHDINMASRYCDRLIALHSGRLLTQGTPQELMTDSTLEAIYGIPMNVLQHAGQPIAVVN